MARQESCASSKALSPSGDPSLPLTSSSQAVRFLLEPSTTFVETSWETSDRKSTKMSTHFDILLREQVTDTMLAEAANLFGDNYGTWGKHSHSPGKPVKLGSRRLREQYIPEPSDSVHARATVNENLAGISFACRWRYNDKNICWVTQLVVSRDYRERGLAIGLLRSLRMEADDIYGILSSHPAACLAAASSFGSLISNVPLDFAKENARPVMDASPIAYIRDAELRGTLFEPENSTELVCGVDTGFFVDHDEPLAALGIVRENWDWPLGGLPDGYEFLLILPAKRRRSISRSPSNPGGVPPADRPQLMSPNPNTLAKRQSISHSSSNPEDVPPAKRHQSTRLSQQVPA